MGLEGTKAFALGEGLQLWHGQMGVFIPSWKVLSHWRSQASVLLRFARDLAVHTAAAQRLADGDRLSLGAFLEVGKLLGEAWCTEDLEQVALLAEADVSPAGDPPIVDGARLARAALPGGFATEFPGVASSLPDA